VSAKEIEEKALADINNLLLIKNKPVVNTSYEAEGKLKSI